MRHTLAAALVAAALLSSGSIRAQDDHAAHHPPGGPPPADSPPSAPSASASGSSGMGPSGGMAGMMAGMMPQSPSAGCKGGDCGSGAAATPIYPSLMTLPALTPAKRAEIDALASQQMSEGMARLAKGSESLNRATQAGDNAAMQQSVGAMRAGLDELEAGIAARRVISEGKAPRNLALDWFKREMNLASPVAREKPPTLLGVTPLHLFTMVLLIAFGLAMVAMYFFKMRRAAALFGRLEADKGSPPPGSAPPLAGAPGPSAPGAPADGKAPPTGGTPPPQSSNEPAPGAPPAGTAPPSEATPVLPPPSSPSPPPSKGAASPGASPERNSPSPAATPPPSPTPPASVPRADEASPALRAQAPAELPLIANWRGQLRVKSIVEETPTVRTFRLVPSSGAGPTPFTFVPGQFLNVAFWIGGARMNRSYSISSPPTHRDYVDLTVRREPRGAVSRHIDDLLKVGDPIEAGGPVGRFTFAGTEADSVVLVSGGVGITPMMSMARYLTELSWPGDIFFLYACRAPIDFIFEKQLATLQRSNPRLHVAVTMSRAQGTDWKGPRGHLTKELFTQTVPDLASRRVHLCGPPSMMDATKAMLAELGVPPEQVKTEQFGAVKPAPAAAGTSAKPSSPATGPLVKFSKNNKSAKIHIGQTVLELSEELAIGIANSCRVGTCGLCKVKLTSGEVEMAVQDALDPEDKTNGVILACQAKPKGDIAVEA